MNSGMTSLQEEKRAIRQKMLALRRALSADTAAVMAEALCDNIRKLPEYKEARRIMAFLAMKGESNLDPFITKALADGKEIYIPVCLPERQMEAGRLLSMDHFEKGPLGLRNLPKGYAVASPKTLDLILVPASACGTDGTRLGMGAGYYDRYLPKAIHAHRIAALWDFQVLPTVPTEPFDQKVEGIVTERRIISCGRSSSL